MTLTCKIGKLEFSDKCGLSKAKLIRDTVVGQILNPPEGSVKLRRDENEIIKFVTSAFKRDSLHLTAIILN
jgi:hypothetical protein